MRKSFVKAINCMRETELLWYGYIGFLENLGKDTVNTFFRRGQ